MIARVLTAMTTAAARTINKGVFTVTSLLRAPESLPAEFSRFKNEPAANRHPAKFGLDGAKGSTPGY